MELPIKGKRLLAIAGFGLALGILAGATLLITARAQCDPAGPPCEPPGEEERERRPTATDTKVALSTFNPTSTVFLCLEYNLWLKCVGNPQCAHLPPCPPSATPKVSSTPSNTATPTMTRTATATAPILTPTQFCLEYNLWLKCLGNPQCANLPPCPPSATPKVSSTPSNTATPTMTRTATATVPSPTGTKFMCLECNEWLKCIGNPQCSHLPRCPWSQCPITTATATPPVKVDVMPIGPVSPIALGIGGAVAMLAAAVMLVRLYKDRT